MTTELAIGIIALIIAALAYAQTTATTRRLRGVPDEEHIAAFLKRVDNEIGAVSDLLADFEPRLISVESRLPYAITARALSSSTPSAMSAAGCRALSRFSTSAQTGS